MQIWALGGSCAHSGGRPQPIPLRPTSRVSEAPSRDALFAAIAVSRPRGLAVVLLAPHGRVPESPNRCCPLPHRTLIETAAVCAAGCHREYDATRRLPVVERGRPGVTPAQRPERPISIRGTARLAKRVDDRS